MMANSKASLIGGALGTLLSATGTATQTNEILQTISLIITILGAVVSMLVIPLLNWYLNAKKDGKFTTEEIKDGAETIQQGVEGIKEALDGLENKEPNKNNKEDK